MLKYLKITPALANVILAAFVVIMLGLWVFNMPVFGSAQRDRNEREMMRSIRNGEKTFAIDANNQLEEITGEEIGYDDGLLAEQGEEEELSDLTLEGMIAIPSIDLNIPLLAGATRANMRYSVCYDTGSGRPGYEGNVIIFGHRMKKRGKHFNRLDEVKNGDSIIITMGDQEFTYKVDDVRRSLEPDEMLILMGLNNLGKRISLVTCTPLGKGTHRLVVMGGLIGIRQVSY